MADIPIVDFSNARNGTRDEKERVAKQIDDAFCQTGFVYLVNHGVARDVVEEGFAWVRTNLFCMLSTSP
jgi:isopenicillin N synthase-like dioxygenase